MFCQAPNIFTIGTITGIYFVISCADIASQGYPLQVPSPFRRTPSPSLLVFSDLEGKPLLPDTVTHAWIKLVRRIGLKGIRLHDARHTHASLMLRGYIRR